VAPRSKSGAWLNARGAAAGRAVNHELPEPASLPLRRPGAGGQSRQHPLPRCHRGIENGQLLGGAEMCRRAEADVRQRQPTPKALPRQGSTPEGLIDRSSPRCQQLACPLAAVAGPGLVIALGPCQSISTLLA